MIIFPPLKKGDQGGFKIHPTKQGNVKMLIFKKLIKFFKYITLIIFLISSLNCIAQNTEINSIGMTTSDQPLATQVGLNVLQQGGNAVDAAVAMGYALAVVYPCCGNLGGGGFMLIHLANGKETVINFREKAPLAITTDLFVNTKGQAIRNTMNTYLGVGVPGTVLGLNTALQKYGTWPLQKIMQPAITLAESGFKLNNYDASLLNRIQTSFASKENILAIFGNQQHPWQVGDKLIQSQLAKTLKLIAAQGSKAFYQGEIADALVKASIVNHGVLSKKDFVDYQIEEQQPIHCRYRDYDVLTIPPPGSGVTVCQILNIVDGYPLRRLGYNTTMSAHYNIEAMRYAYADRNTFLGDPDFTAMPLQKLLSPEHAANIRAKILPFRAGDSSQLGFLAKNNEAPQTTAYAVVDNAGNIVVVTYTINSFFGSKNIAGDTGFFLNDEIDDFTVSTTIPNQFGLIQGKPNLLAPAKRPLSSISPIIIFKNGKFIATLAAAGGATIPTQVVLAAQNIIDYDMNITRAIHAERYHMQWLPDLVYIQPFVFSLITQIQLHQMGYHFQEGWSGKLFWGALVGIMQDKLSGKLIGSAEH